MAKCSNCIGRDAIVKFVSTDCTNLRIIERAVNKLANSKKEAQMARNSLLGVSEILMAKKVQGVDSDVEQVLLECGISATCLCE